MAILTVSRQYGSGGKEIAQAAAKLLGYEYINKEQILADIRLQGKEWERWSSDLDERCPTLWEKYDWSFRGFGSLIQSHILNYALKDRVVIIGRGGNFLLKGIPHSLRIRVAAPIDRRVERIMLREGLDSKTARWLAEKTDSERSCFINIIYGRHWDAKEEYDMVFDTALQTDEEIIDIVRNALLDKDNLHTEEAGETLKMRALAAKVKAGILTNPNFFIPTLDVFYDGKGIVLKAVIHNPKEHKRLESEAKRLAGDAALRFDLHYRG